ncbi:MAG: hypothetical protein CMN00_06110 [Rickettsiales bacterium]|nr:hypothetical protein [Rickettsiales bacterium]
MNLKFFIPFMLFFICSESMSENKINEKVIEDYILNNPEIIIKSLRAYEEMTEKKNQEELKLIIKQNIKKLIKTNAYAYTGKADSELIVVEFLDYNCGYCKKAHNELLKLLKEDSEIKIVYRNLPILSQNSMQIAKISTSIGLLNNRDFNKFHDFLLSSRKLPDDKKIRGFIEEIGLSFNEILKSSNSEEVQEIINRDIEMANLLNIKGTPAFLIGNELVTGYVSKNILKSLVYDQQ